MKKVYIVGFLALMAFGAWHMHHVYYFHKEPPPNWTIMCNGEGYFGARFPKSGHIIEKSLNGDFMTSRQAAINRAWAQYEFQQPEEKHLHGEWQNCDGEVQP